MVQLKGLGYVYGVYSVVTLGEGMAKTLSPSSRILRLVFQISHMDLPVETKGGLKRSSSERLR